MTRAALLVALVLGAGCSHYWVRNEALAQLSRVDEQELGHVAVPALRIGRVEERPVHLRGVYVRPEENNGARPGWRQVEAHSRELTAGILVLSIGGVAAISSAVALGACTSPGAGACHDNAVGTDIGGFFALGVGGGLMLVGTVFTIIGTAGHPQEWVRERDMRILDGPRAQPLSGATYRGAD